MLVCGLLLTVLIFVVFDSFVSPHVHILSDILRYFKRMEDITSNVLRITYILLFFDFYFLLRISYNSNSS